MTVLYVDTSALAKTVLAEAESAAVISLLDGLRADQVWSSALTRTELVRSIARSKGQRTGFARQRLARVSLIALSDSLLDAAAALSPAVLRSLDAIHVASAMRLGADLDAVLTYDNRTADAARANGLTVLAPT